MSKPKPTENPRRQWGDVVKHYNFQPNRMGETVRKCEWCGKEYAPTVRTQRFCCKECREGRTDA